MYDMSMSVGDNRSSDSRTAFADPSTTVGAEVDVKTKLTSASSMQSMEATLTYDKVN